MQYETNHLGQLVDVFMPNWKPPVVPPRASMEGAYCRLEPLDTVRHGRQLFEANSLDTENRNWTYLPYGPFDGFESYIAWLREAALKTDVQFFAIVDKVSAKAVGLASYLRIDPNNGSIEVGHLNFSPLLQAKPTATEAMYLMMKQAFDLGYRRYEWKCNALNLPSRRAAQRLGLSYEGVFRQATISKGRSRNTAWYAAIDKEWPELQSAFTRWLDASNFDANGMQKISLSKLTVPILKQIG
ncbi:MAG: N-acetyltransferase [Pseudomonadota bacterium]|jgi:RimJ/RimL family protein N-acetyltransferase